MSKIVRLADLRLQNAPVFFNRADLNLLLALYSRRVAAGDWRDYAIEHGPGKAVFSIFRTALERPLFTVSKIMGNGQGCRYVVATGERKLVRAATMQEALAVLDRTPKLVSI